MDNQATIKDLAYLDYMGGMKYKDIAEKHGIPLNTFKSWKKREKWQRKPEKVKSTPNKKSVQQRKKSAPKKTGAPKPQKKAVNVELRNAIRSDLIDQLNEKGAGHAHYIDMVNDYMSLWDIKNMLIDDIETRGVVVVWNNNTKKNDSIAELNKTNAQMLKIISELDLKVVKKPKGVKFGGDDDGNDGAFEDI